MKLKDQVQDDILCPTSGKNVLGGWQNSVVLKIVYLFYLWTGYNGIKQ